MRLEVRPAQPRDDEAICELSRRAGLGVDPERERSLAHSRLWVGEVDDPQRRVVGFVVLWCVLDEVEIQDLLVDPRWRRRGVARALVQQACEALTAQGGRRLQLEVRRSNRAAKALYLALGLQPEGERLSYYADGEDAVLFGGCLPLPTRSTLAP